MWHGYSTGRRLRNDGALDRQIAQTTADDEMATALRAYRRRRRRRRPRRARRRTAGRSSPRQSTRTSPSLVLGPTTTPRIGGTGRFFGDYVNWERIDGYRQAALHGPLPELARTLLGETPRFFHEHTLVKERDTHEVTPWHHDEPYYCIDGASNVSLWVSLDPVPQRSRRRVHRRLAPVGPSVRATQVRRPVSYVDDASGFELVPDIDAVRDQHEIVSFDVEPGDVIAFHYRTLHSAPGTAGRTQRLAGVPSASATSAAMRGSPPGRGCTRRRTTRSRPVSRSTTSAFPCWSLDLKSYEFGGRVAEDDVDIEWLASRPATPRRVSPGPGRGSWRSVLPVP